MREAFLTRVTRRNRNPLLRRRFGLAHWLPVPVTRFGANWRPRLISKLQNIFTLLWFSTPPLPPHRRCSCARSLASLSLSLPLSPFLALPLCFLVTASSYRCYPLCTFFSFFYFPLFFPPFFFFSLFFFFFPHLSLLLFLSSLFSLFHFESFLRNFCTIAEYISFLFFFFFFFFFTRFLPRFFPLHSFRLYPRNSRGFDAPRQSRRGETKRNILDSANDVLMGRKGEAIESVIVRCLRFRLFIFAGSLVRIFRTL